MGSDQKSGPETVQTKTLADAAGHQRQAQILNAVARATEKILGAGSWRESAPLVLEILGEATGVSRVYLFERTRHEQAHAFVSQRNEWVRVGVEPQINNPDLQDIDLEASGFERWVELMRGGRAVVGDIEEFPPSERPMLEAQSIRSLLIQPIFAGPHWWGFLGFDACEQEQRWAPEEVDTLRVAALVLGSSVHLEQREQQFRQSHKMEALGRMAGGIAHDFNNMLAVMVASLDLLGRAMTDPRQQGQALQHLGVLHQAISKASQLTKQLLNFSRRRDTQARELDPLLSIRGMGELLRQAAGSRVRVEIDGVGVVEKIQIDPTQLEQLVMNLVVNARDAMPRGGALQIRLHTLESEEALAHGDTVPVGRWTMLSVRDSGHGIAPEIRDRIFEPFFSTKEVGQGTGLGLAMVYSALSSAGGHVRLASEAGLGTEIRLYFPVARAAAEERPAPPPAPAVVYRGNGERVLVCDDNPALAAWAARALTEHGYRATPAEGPEQCLRAAEEERGEIALLLTDVRMPGMDGPTLWERLRERLPGLPVLFMSGFAADLLSREGIEASSEAFLDKPFSREQLLAAVQGALQRRSEPPREAPSQPTEAG